MSKIETTIFLVLLFGSIFLGGYTLYTINTTDIHSVVSQFVN